MRCRYLACWIAVATHARARTHAPHAHTHTPFNTHSLSTVTMVTRPRLKAAFIRTGHCCVCIRTGCWVIIRVVSGNDVYELRNTQTCGTECYRESKASTGGSMCFLRWVLFLNSKICPTFSFISNVHRMPPFKRVLLSQNTTIVCCYLYLSWRHVSAFPLRHKIVCIIKYHPIFMINIILFMIHTVQSPQLYISCDLKMA